jgi:hypothetical protein
MVTASEGRDVWRRPEALPLRWQLLSEQQQAAVDRLAGWLLDAMSSLDARPRARHAEAGSAELDYDRRSQITFVDGDRGTGKTSVLLTLRALTSNGYGRTGLPSTAERLWQVRNRVRWLETLDMEPLSRGTNLFAAILARVAATIEGHYEPLSPMATALAEPRGGFEQVTASLQQLQNDAAIVWDRIGSGSPEADPQLRALWVNQAERAALDLNGRIGKVMDGVASLLTRGGGEELLFVVPVDDFDLSPAHSLELLRLIRMVTTPRLVFVVAGSVRVAETVLQLKSEGDLAALAGPAGAQTTEYRARASEIAANNMRKLVPPGQRVVLRELRLNEALDLGGSLPDVAGAPTGGDTLRSALSRVQFECNQAPTARPVIALAKFLGVDDRSRPPASEADWLAGTPRQVLDYVSLFDEMARLGHDSTSGRDDEEQARVQANDAIVTLLLDELRRQIGEEWRLPPIERERMRDGLDSRVAVRADFAHLRVGQAYGSAQLVSRFEHGDLVRYGSGRGLVSTRLGDVLRQDDQGVPDAGRFIELPRRVGAGLTFLHDVIVSIWGGYLSEPLTYAASGHVGPNVHTRWRASGEEGCSVRWPVPEWWTFRDIERFDRAVTELQGTDSESMGPAWLAAMLTVSLDEPVQPRGRAKVLGEIDAMLGRLLDEAPRRTARQVLRDSVLLCATLLYAPEYASGLVLGSHPANVQRMFDQVGRGELAARVRAVRASNLIRISAKEAADRPSLIVRTAICPERGAAAILRKAVQAARRQLIEKAAVGTSETKTEPTRPTSLARLASMEDTLAAGRVTRTQLDRAVKKLPVGAEIGTWATLAQKQLAHWSNHAFNLFARGAFVPTDTP